MTTQNEIQGNTAFVYLDYKLRNVSKNSNKYDSLGRMDEDYIYGDILLGKFNRDAVRNAIDFCVEKETLQKYYEYRCPNCNTLNVILEQSPEDNSTLQSLYDSRPGCQHCEASFNPNISVETKYAVNQKYLDNGQGEKNRKSLIDQWFGWLLPWR